MIEAECVFKQLTHPREFNALFGGLWVVFEMNEQFGIVTSMRELSFADKHHTSVHFLPRYARHPHTMKVYDTLFDRLVSDEECIFIKTILQSIPCGYPL